MDPKLFAYLRRELAKTPPDQLTKMDALRLKNFLMATLEVCEWWAQEQLDQEGWDINALADPLRLHLERLPLPQR
jgi:hypothetical protein